MNFLAHIYLSGDNDLIKIGNFMADGIRGKHFESFPLDVQKGIVLHRAIDTFTDAHPIFRKSTKRLHENYHHYAGVIVDVFYDHFLAKNWVNYSDENLDTYVANFYQSLLDNTAILTERTLGMMPYMIKHNWLESYQTIDGIDKILTQMDSRTKNESKMRFASAELKEYYADFEKEFTEFFKELILFSNDKIMTL
ncbi:acyl carrier protein phosphodiesterase [Flavobacterium sp. CG_23.5]|uniref:acyl carrier protein phosphodiesterase n=1 Tax=Flavobacterium sp. CG_23.5 TaxID=2760708 RepID=UPI001AE5B377|nr:acyl carrier protein phosphodiesterase [Flavobacterium sp. CG_23.5]MBP2282261.1 acyl carrier protein phosphodiesterase [Flavobacterium sp. CG_23.5]